MSKSSYKSNHKDKHEVNFWIKSQELRVIDEEGNNVGVLNKKEALDLAKARELDLVVISPKAVPPVARILDYNKFLYEERKKASASKAKSKKSELKEFRFGPTIGEGDLNQRIERAREFIEDNNRVKFTIRLKGREMKYPEIAFEKIGIITNALSEVARTEQQPKQSGNRVEAIFVKN